MNVLHSALYILFLIFFYIFKYYKMAMQYKRHLLPVLSVLDLT